jgi:hypothetical protein
VQLALLYSAYRSQLPEMVQMPELHPNEALGDRLGAVVGSALLLACLAMLAAAGYLGWELWAVALAFAVAHAAFDLVTRVAAPAVGLRARYRGLPGCCCCRSAASAGQEHGGRHAAVAAGTSEHGGIQLQALAGTAADPRCGAGAAAGGVQALQGKQRAGSSGGGQRLASEGVQAGPSGDAARPEAQRTLLRVWLGLPWEIAPFVLGMFVMVEGLAVNGWVDALAQGLAQASSSIPATLFLFGAVSVLLANVINNQPMTILLTRVCLSPEFSSAVSGRSLLGALLAMVAASNLGAMLTMIGALAGIMWAATMRQQGVHVGYVQFTRLMSLPGVVCTAVVLLVLWLELSVL